MIKGILCLFMISAACVTGYCQEDGLFRLVRQYPREISDFSVDNLGNLYLVYQNGQLKKLKANGDSMAVFNNVRRFGKLHSIDVSNPLKVLLFYKNFSTIVILDRLLNERSVLDLRQHNLVQVKAIGQSYDNNIWVFDEVEAKLKKIGDDGRPIDQSNDLRQVLDSAPAPQYIVDRGKFVYLYDSSKGVYAFDYYGGYKSRVPFTGWTDFDVINTSLVGRTDGTLFRYDYGTLDLKKLPLPPSMSAAEKITVSGANLYVLAKGALNVYSINLPTTF